MRFALVSIATGQVLTGFPNDAVPNPVIWPNGDQTCAASVGDERVGARLVRVVYGPESPGEFYQIAGVTPKLVGDTLTFERDWQPIDLAKVKATVADRIAQMLSARAVSPDGVSPMVYFQRVDEARTAAKDAAPSPDKYPVLAAGLADGADLGEAARACLDAHAEWVSSAAQLEKSRVSASAALAEAATVDDAARVAADAAIASLAPVATISPAFVSR